jgi:hypothetical protein
MTSARPHILKVERRKKATDWDKILDFLVEQGIIDADFTGDLCLEFNQGGVSRCRKAETIK